MTVLLYLGVLAFWILSAFLEDMLKKAIGDENYEEASRLRDEIKKRKEKL